MTFLRNLTYSGLVNEVWSHGDLFYFMRVCLQWLLELQCVQPYQQTDMGGKMKPLRCSLAVVEIQTTLVEEDQAMCLINLRPCSKELSSKTAEYISKTIDFTPKDKCR